MAVSPACSGSSFAARLLTNTPLHHSLSCVLSLHMSIEIQENVSISTSQRSWFVVFRCAVVSYLYTGLTHFSSTLHPPAQSSNSTVLKPETALDLVLATDPPSSIPCYPVVALITSSPSAIMFCVASIARLARHLRIDFFPFLFRIWPTLPTFCSTSASFAHDVTWMSCVSLNPLHLNTIHFPRSYNFLAPCRIF